MAAPIRVLMVCTGNICRSPTAEVVLRQLAERAGCGHRLSVASAGTHGYHVGEPPDRRAQAHARARGYDLSGLRARRLAAEDFQACDWLLAMDAGHLQAMRQLRPADAPGQLALLLTSPPGRPPRDVPDPYYGEAADFERVIDLVEQGCQDWLQRWGLSR